MKTRTGFVSNSSSSSFIAYGGIVPGGNNDLIALIETTKPGALFEKFGAKLKVAEDGPEFLEKLHEAMDEWMVEPYELSEGGFFNVPVEVLHEEDQIVIGYMVDTEDEWGVSKVFGETFTDKKVAEVRAEMERLNLEPNLLIGRRSC